ncbi:MAG TPA: sigma-70 family RNA polymerase sigma factor [Candidatus Merdivicinus intestinigallinarum]|nr:sigma-70 family RNA polymerase sigma factor [Candidatus Merdivicinus intestinigallinarum]
MAAVPQLTDEELAEQYQKRNSAALAELMSRYLPLIQKYAVQYQNVFDFDDLVQEGCIGLFDAVRSFHRDNHTKFSTYALVCIRNRVQKAVEKATSQKAAAFRNHVPLEDAGEVSDHSSPEQIFLNREALEAVMNGIQTLLTPMERKVLFAALDGMDYQTIAKSLNISPKSVDNALQRVRRKLKTIHRP